MKSKLHSKGGKPTFNRGGGMKGRDEYRSGGAVSMKGRGSANGGGMSAKSPMSSAGNMKGGR